MRGGLTLFSQTPTLTNSERNENALRALCKLIPYVGDSMNQWIFGALDDLRLKRLESSLQDINANIERLGATAMRTEEFAALLEAAAPRLARATNEDVRARLRDLLTKAALLSAEDERWEQARLAERLLSELEGPALAIIAAIARAPRTGVAIVSRPRPQVVEEKAFNWDTAELGPHVIGYTPAVVVEWGHRLREKRLVHYSSVDARGGFGNVSLTDLGQMLVDWTVSTP